MLDNNSRKHIVILASGTGSNAKAIVNYFSSRRDIRVSHILSNNPNAEVLDMAKDKGIPTYSFNRKALYKSKEVLYFLNKSQPDLIVLAGFMWIIPEGLIKAFPNKIINLHPSLLPKYGGKGMYGENVHQAVLDHKESETGISIHYINEKYDEGKIIAQFKTPVNPDDKRADLIEKIKNLEHANYAKVIDNLLSPNQ